MCTDHVHHAPTLSIIVNKNAHKPCIWYLNIVNNNQVNSTSTLSRTIYITWIFFLFFLAIFALITILGNMHRPCI
ncbi:uncharacterized protein LACBIDRAFT_308386 [Laccaria bicolor S238N-H82]|uniref:Predicted protein n=1 Tax=Laccaria bicolor (strain S238N-H82 / ATCC MYA-4686) TaxID=486041 RepID=B0CW55_LACBS|nr:uncharacterized protein LACBIDRAFT_308386 [Laccaria bicolor S238N-H82]EDR13452.1 predicted protein [Laccaria bicolor S238N-H82]|eukprot:XP_001875950.1 predicted protein [Laccaria bicolor S238N-H82]